MSYFITRENILDWLVSFGLELKSLTNPSAHPYSDPKRAKPYEGMLRAARLAYSRLAAKEDPVTIIQWLKRQVSGIESNHCARLLDALRGDYELNDFSFPKKHEKEMGKHLWVTYKGDFYSINTGDYLNIPCVCRIANKHMGVIKLDGAKEIANMMPNPCTRVKAPIQVC